MMENIEQKMVGLKAWLDRIKDQPLEEMDAFFTARIDGYDEHMLDTWAEPSPYTMKPTDASHYAALIIHMPEEVGDIANYRGANQPRVDLGIKVFAQQSGTDMYD